MKKINRNSNKRSQKKNDPLSGDLTPLLKQGGWKKVKFELMPKKKSITLRLSEELLDAIKLKAEEEGLDYQKWIRASIEETLKRSA
jgi:predicted DNA binding CopG/RHH family protein